MAYNVYILAIAFRACRFAVYMHMFCNTDISYLHAHLYTHSHIRAQIYLSSYMVCVGLGDFEIMYCDYWSKRHCNYWCIALKHFAVVNRAEHHPTSASGVNMAIII